MSKSVAIVHDYLTQRGGAERVVLTMKRAFPDADLYTSLFDATATFPEFRAAGVRVLPINRIALLRHHHRLALPLLAPSFSTLSVVADTVICSSSGWAHGVRVRGRKIVYCYTPAHWLYQADKYLGTPQTGRNLVVKRVAIQAVRRPLQVWDRAAMKSAETVIVMSEGIRQRVCALYGVNARTIPPPVLDLTTRQPSPVPGAMPGFLLCVSRLLPYKNVATLLRAMHLLDGEHLIVAGSGPDLPYLRSIAPANATLVGAVSDQQLAWLYENCRAVIAPSYEDFGLVPLEAAMFGKASAALAWGGYLDTVKHGETGVLFDVPTASAVATAVSSLLSLKLSSAELRRHGHSFGEPVFVQRMRDLVNS